MTHADHLGVAEAGKLRALAGDHLAALEHYREAMRRAVSARAPEVFFRHYLQISLESLELAGDLAAVSAFGDRALAHYRDAPPTTLVARKDLASIEERQGLVKLKQGHVAEARALLERACESASTEGFALPLASVVLRWLRAGLHVTPERILHEQHRHAFFSVRPDCVDASRATALPTTTQQAGGPSRA